MKPIFLRWQLTNDTCVDINVAHIIAIHYVTTGAIITTSEIEIDKGNRYYRIEGPENMKKLKEIMALHVHVITLRG